MASIKHNLNNFYQKLCATKVHLWSHCLALIGWYGLFLSIHNNTDTYNQDLLTNIIKNYESFWFLLLILFFIYFIETLFFFNFKIKNNILEKNKIYNITWNIGISFILYKITFVIIIFIKFLIDKIPIY